MTTDELLSKMANVLQCAGLHGYGFYARALLQPHYAFGETAREAMEKALQPAPVKARAYVVGDESVEGGQATPRRRVIEDDDELPVRRPTQPPTRRRASLFEDDE